MNLQFELSGARAPAEGHVTIKPSVLYFGTPVALVTSLNRDGTTNISPMSSVWALFDRVALGLTTTSMGRENVVREKELVINFPSAGLWAKVEALARATGRNPVPPHKPEEPAIILNRRNSPPPVCTTPQDSATGAAAAHRRMSAAARSARRRRPRPGRLAGGTARRRSKSSKRKSCAFTLAATS